MDEATVDILNYGKADHLMRRACLFIVAYLKVVSAYLI
jgi:hypothetical protein